MIRLSKSNIKTQFKYINAIIEAGASSPLFYDNFLKKATPFMRKSYKEKDLVYPKEIRVPKPLSSLLDHDFEPARVIRIEEPPYIIHPETGEKILIWYGNTTKGVYFRPGFLNGDSRYPCTVRLDDKGVHAMAAGKTGMGKSVLMNGIIYTMCWEYPPWELKLIMTDSKVSEFLRYTRGKLIPHIATVAATTDAEYVISTIHSLVEEMELMYSLMGDVGCNNIEDLREKIKLDIPRVVIPMDEVQTAFKHAGRKADQLAKDLDSFVLLGRAVGYHIIMASQGFGSEIGKNTLSNITIRCALGCGPDMSTKILGNDEAKVIKTKGRLIINTNSDEGKKSDNKEYRVPFQPEPQFEWMKDLLFEKGEEYGFSYPLSFYNENAVRYSSSYPQYLRGFANSPNDIILGDPSYISKDPEGILRITLDGTDNENIAIVSPKSEGGLRNLQLLKYNIDLHRENTQVLVIHNDEDMFKKSGLEEIATVVKFIREGSDQEFKNMMRNIVLRKALIVADQKAFAKPVVKDFAKDFIAKHLANSPLAQTNLNRARISELLALFNANPDYEILGLHKQDLEKYAKYYISYIEKCLKDYEKYNCHDKKIVAKDFPRLFIFIIGFNKINGFGRVDGFRSDTLLPKMMMDACVVNAVFVLQTRKGEELTNVKGPIRYFICENLQTKDYSRFGCEDTPGAIPVGLNVLYDKTEDDFFKFKKLVLDGERMF